MLMDDALYGCQTDASPFDFLGGVETLEDAK
jgi:hypothetical protein